MRQRGIIICSLVIVLLLTSSTSFIVASPVSSDERDVPSQALFSPMITSLSQNCGFPGESVTVYGSGFGATPGYVVITGLHVEATIWSDTSITIVIPQDAASGFLYIRNENTVASNSVGFTVSRQLETGFFEPATLRIADTGLPGSAFLVETDGDYLYGITGFETLTTYEIHDHMPYELRSRIYLPQRVGDLRLHNGYLFCTGDQGLFIFRCSDLQQGNTEPIIATAGGHFLGVDVREKPGAPINGVLVALCDYLPSLDTQELRTILYKFQDEELIRLGAYHSPALDTERQHAIAIDPLNPKVYVSGFETLLGNQKYILELSIDNPSQPILNHKEETGSLLAFDMETRGDILWIGISNTGTELFRTYRLHPGSNHLLLDQIITGNYGIGRTTRVKIIEDQYTVGSAWSGARPDIFLLDTFNSGTVPLASYSTIDWAFDITGYSVTSDDYNGKIIVADEWAGFCTYEYRSNPNEIIHQQDYHWAPATAMTQNIHLSDTRVYIANRGAGVWSADRHDLSDETQWRHVAWDWMLNDPQPHPVSGLAIREDPDHGMLIAGLGHEKAMAWGSKVYGILYKETSQEIVHLAMSEEVIPPGLFVRKEAVVWPEQDLVFMTTGSDGFRAYVVNPDAPSITLHQSCYIQGFGTDVFSTANVACVMEYYQDESGLKLLIGSNPGLLVAAPSFHVFSITYPEGVPDRNHPQRPINVELESSLSCTSWKTMDNLDVTDSGLISLATTGGLAVFHYSWINYLNSLSTNQAWSKITVPTQSFQPWWDASWSVLIADVGFVDDQTIYCVKKPQEQRAGGVWELSIEIDMAAHSHSSSAQGYYPGVQCGIDYSQLLQGWTNPDIITIHHPYALVADESDVYVTGWSGKVQRITNRTENQPPATPSIQGEANGKVRTLYTYTVSTVDPDGDTVFYFIDWGDQTNTGWIGPYASGDEITQSHKWSKKGTYLMRVMAKDIQGSVSDWGTLTVIMPHPYNIPLLPSWVRFFERFPHAFPILRHLLGY